MNQQNRSYPVKVVSRSLPSTRTNKLRFSWFLMGATFGGICGFAGHMPQLPAQLTASAAMPAPAPVEAASAAPTVPPVTVSAAAEATPPEQQIASAAPVAAAPAPVADDKENDYPVSLNLKVENGDTLIDLLTDSGVPKDEAYNVWESIKKAYNPKKLDIGQMVAVNLDKGQAATDKPYVKSLVLPISLISSVELTRTADNNFTVKKLDKPVERKMLRAGGEIRGSLYETAANKGVPAPLLNEIIQAYSYDVDFQRDIKEGDEIDVLYDRMQTADGTPAGRGNIIYAELDTGDRELKLYRYTDASGHSEFYTAKGESVRKAMLRTPINGARITSGFGMRNHPVLGYTRMHRGVDFGAAEGTPIYAAGDGVIEFEGRKGGYGNYLKIKHNAKYASAYAHISRFASGISVGSHVKQGQVVAYVGMTGLATGPHLHYEILVNNEQVNPAGVKFKTGNVLAGKDLAAFRKNVDKVEAALQSTPQNEKVASRDDGKKPIELADNTAQ